MAELGGFDEDLTLGVIPGQNAVLVVVEIAPAQGEVGAGQQVRGAGRGAVDGDEAAGPAQHFRGGVGVRGVCDGRVAALGSRVIVIAQIRMRSSMPVQIQDFQEALEPLKRISAWLF